MCGIWAIINREPEPFDYQTFCTLGCANDRRGGDSCGVFIDGKTEYGIGDKSLFEAFFWTSELLNNTNTATIALGHDRKASVGMPINLQNAHPIVIEEDVPVGEGEEPRKEIKFVMVHNGTIYNYKELAKKYIPNVDITGMTDSQVLARLLYYSGYDFLAEYNGGTAFIAVDYRKEIPEVILWRGESKKNSYSKEAEEERPLFVSYENDRLVISSICSYLAICDGNCYILPANQVIRYKNGKLQILKEINRSKATQTQVYEYGSESNGAYTNPYYKNRTNVGVTKYMGLKDLTNTYRIGEVNADGYIRMTIFGKILTKFDSCSQVENPKMLYFFNGIPLIEKKAYLFLCKAWKRTKLDLDSFTIMYQNLIRYFSVDKTYPENLLMYEATGPFNRKLFTGWHQMLTTAVGNRYNNGMKTAETRTTTVADSFSQLNEVPQYDYKTIWKEFIQSMG